MRILGLITALMVAPAFAQEPIGDAALTIPIFDAHIHYKEPAWNVYPPKTVIKMMDRNGVAMGLVSSTPDAGTIKLWKYAKGRIVPELRPYRESAGSSDWTKDEGMEAYLEDRLAQYPHEGIGEFHIRSIDPDDEDLLRAVTQMAKVRDIPIHVHSSAEPVELLYRLEPSLTVIWAHVGMTDGPDIAMKMFDKYPTLYADTSYRENDILVGGTLNTDWAKVIRKHHDRLLIGSDTWVNSQWDVYDAIIDVNRKWLSLLPKEQAENIAYKNAERLFGRKIDLSLIGTR